MQIVRIRIQFICHRWKILRRYHITLFCYCYYYYRLDINILLIVAATYGSLLWSHFNRSRLHSIQSKNKGLEALWKSPRAAFIFSMEQYRKHLSDTFLPLPNIFKMICETEIRDLNFHWIESELRSFIENIYIST